MEEMRVKEMISQHFLSRASESIHSSSHAGVEFSQKSSPVTDWLLGNHLPSSRNAQWPKSFVGENFQKLTTLQTDSFVRRNSEYDTKFLSPSSKRNGNSIIDLEFPADTYDGDQVKRFKGRNLSESSELTCRTPEKISDFQPVNHSDIGSSRTWDLSSSSSDIKKSNCFIDLNEPIQLEDFSGCNGTVYREECVSVKATPESIVLTHSKLLKSGESSNGVNSSMAFDLNSIPVNCFSDIEMNLESSPSIKRETKDVLDCSSEDKSIVQRNNSGSFLQTGSFIDLNTDVVDDSGPQSNLTLEIKSVEHAELKGPVSPENEERSPPRGKSEDIQLGTPLSSEVGERETLIELETTAAQTLVMLFSSGPLLEPLANFRNLSWFAEIASSNGHDQGEENALNSSCFNKGKGKGNAPRRSVKGQKKRKKQNKDFKTDPPKEDFLEKVPPKRKASKNSYAKPRKYSKLSPSDGKKAPANSILRQSDAVVQPWGRTRKRGGRRRRVNEFFIIT